MGNAKQTPLRIGIYAGAFDPIHAGHIAFALQALRVAKLDEVIFMPERRPRHKPGVEHFAHRVAMLKRALKPYDKFSVAEFVDGAFTVRRTMPQLKSLVPAGSQFVLITGSDTVSAIPGWPQIDELLPTCELVIGLRDGQDQSEIETLIKSWPLQPRQLEVFESHAPHISSTAIRAALRANRYSKGLLTSVRRYAREQWLYVSLDLAQNRA